MAALMTVIASRGMPEPPQASLTIEFALACLSCHLVRVASNFDLFLARSPSNIGVEATVSYIR